MTARRVIASCRSKMPSANVMARMIMEVFDAGRLISQADAECSGRAGEVDVRAYGLQATDGFGHAHRAHLRSLEGDHFSEVAGLDQFDRLCAEDGTECAIKARWAATALQVAENADASFLAGARFDLLSNNGADSAE